MSNAITTVNCLILTKILLCFQNLLSSWMPFWNVSYIITYNVCNVLLADVPVWFYTGKKISYKHKRGTDPERAKFHLRTTQSAKRVSGVSRQDAPRVRNIQPTDLKDPELDWLLLCWGYESTSKLMATPQLDFQVYFWNFKSAWLSLKNSTLHHETVPSSRSALLLRSSTS
jgi:hypothetical protein